MDYQELKKQSEKDHIINMLKCEVVRLNTLVRKLKLDQEYRILWEKKD